MKRSHSSESDSDSEGSYDALSESMNVDYETSLSSSNSSYEDSLTSGDTTSIESIGSEISTSNPYKYGDFTRLRVLRSTNMSNKLVKDADILEQEEEKGQEQELQQVRGRDVDQKKGERKANPPTLLNLLKTARLDRALKVINTIHRRRNDSCSPDHPCCKTIKILATALNRQKTG